MGDRFLVPVASVGIAYLLRHRWRATPRDRSPAGLALVAVGALTFPPAWFLLVQVGPRTLLLWWLAGALAAAVIGLLAAHHGWGRARLMLFPVLFTLFALPTPDALQSRLLPWLKTATTAGATAVLPWLGVPATRAGFTVELPTGALDVVDACSGALSLTSLVAISVLTGYVRTVFRRDFNISRAIALVGLTLPIVIASNTLRVIVTGVLRYYVGPEAIEGFWHEVLGYSVILVGFGLIVAVSQKLAYSPLAVPEQAEPAPSRSVGGDSTGWWAVAILLPAAAASAWSEQFRQVHRDIADLSAVATAFPGWEVVDRPVPANAVEMLKCDQILYREYEDPFGMTVQAYFMFWATPASTAHIHHPDVCWPSRGCTLVAGRVRPVRYAAGREPLGVSVRHYDERDGRRQVVFYWTQNGATVLEDGQEPADRGSEYAWVADMLRGRQPPERVSRLSVLLAADVPLGRPADVESRMEGLAAQIASRLYRVCPWAAPTK
jgi:exosortase